VLGFVLHSRHKYLQDRRRNDFCVAFWLLIFICRVRSSGPLLFLLVEAIEDFQTSLLGRKTESES
jgi:hypothetical protein